MIVSSDSSSWLTHVRRERGQRFIDTWKGYRSRGHRVLLVIGTFMSQSITSAVAVPPMLWIPHQLVGAPLGYSVTLECYTEAHPTSLNYWAREDGLMIHESSKYKTTSSPDRPSYKTHMTLTIFDIQVSEWFLIAHLWTTI